MKKIAALLLILPLLFTNVGVVFAALDTNLNHYYSYDTNSNDAIGSNNGTDTNTPTYTAGKISNALTLVAASSQYTSFSNTSLFPYGTNTYTMNVWVKYTTTSGNQSICMNYNATPGNLLFYLSGGTLIHSKGGIVDLSYSWSPSSATYYMLTFVGSSTGMATYVNAVGVASNANTSNIADWGGSLPCGAYKSSGVIQAGWYMDGQQDEMGIWSRALSQAEITQLYNGGAGLAYPFTPAATTPTTLGFFRFFKRF